MGIKLFEHANFKGDHDYFTLPGIYNLEDVLNGTFSGWIIDNLSNDDSVENDELSSYILDPSTRVTFYEHMNKGGRSFTDENLSPTEKKEVAFIGNEWNDVISSIEIEPVFVISPQPELDTKSNLKGVTFFEDWKFNTESDRSIGALLKARAQTLDVGEYPILPHDTPIDILGSPGIILGVRSDSISSLIVGKDYYVELYDRDNFSGNLLLIKESTADIRVLRKEHYTVTEVEQAKIWNDRTRSIKVLKYPVPR